MKNEGSARYYNPEKFVKKKVSLPQPKLTDTSCKNALM